MTTRASNSLLVALNSLVGDKNSEIEKNIQKLYKTLAGHLDYLFVTSRAPQLAVCGAFSAV